MMPTARYVCCVWVWILILNSLSAQHASKIHALADEFCANNQFNGSMLVIEAGNTILKKAVGFQKSKSQAVDLQTVFNLGDASTSFTAMAIAILQEEGKLRWSDRVAKHLKAFPYQHLRIQDLLWHRSGLPDYFLLCERYWEASRPINNHDLFELICQHEPRLHFPAGWEFEFCNTNYALLALIVERVSQQSFREFLQKNVFNPLMMQDAFVYNPMEVAAEIATAFRLTLGEEILYYPPSYLDGIVGDKGIYASIQDMEKWIFALQAGELLKIESYQMLFQEGTLTSGEGTQYAMGWVTILHPQVLYHDGAWRGFHSTIFWYPKKAHAVVLLSNRSDRVVHLQRLISRILEEKPPRKPRPTLLERLTKNGK